MAIRLVTRRRMRMRGDGRRWVMLRRHIYTVPVCMLMVVKSILRWRSM